MKLKDIDWPLVDEPDWPAVQREYEGGSLTVLVLARRYGVKPGQIGYRAKCGQWRRPGAKPAPVRTTEEELGAMVRQTRLAIGKVMSRDTRLMKRIEKEGGDLDRQLAQHRTGVATLAMVLKSMAGWHKIAAASGKGQGGHEPSERDEAEFQDRLDRLAAALREKEAV